MFNDDLSVVVGCGGSGKTFTLYSFSEILNSDNRVAWIYFNKNYGLGENFKKVSSYQFSIDSYGLGEIPITQLSNDIKTIEIIKEYIERGKIDYLIIDDFDIININLHKIILDMEVKKIISINFDINGYYDYRKYDILNKYKQTFYNLNIHDQMKSKTIIINNEILQLEDYITSLKREAKLNNLLDE